MSTQDNTSIAAIVIAIIAFFVTVGQLLQAIFGTAEGYRNCQASVIGKWANDTKRKWRWSEFRFETRFKTPNILLTDEDESRVDYLLGSDDSRKKTRVPDSQGSDVNSDLVGWLRLLDQLHKYTPSCVPNGVDAVGYGLGIFGGTTLPAITVRERSWDFMPPEITRPFATSNVGDIIALAHRLGMFWTDLRPADGIMRAEGNGSSIISTTIRGFGLLLQFTHDEAAERPKHELPPATWVTSLRVSQRESNPRKKTGKLNLIPTAAADKLGFQIIPGDHRLGRVRENGERIGLPDFACDERNRSKIVRDALKELGLEYVEQKYYRYMGRHDYIGFSDLLPLVAPFMNFHPSLNPNIIAPHAAVDDSPFRCREGFFVFRNRSKPPPPESRTDHVIRVHDLFNEMDNKYHSTWMEGPLSTETQYGDLDEFVRDLQRIWDQTTQFLDKLERDPQYTWNQTTNLDELERDPQYTWNQTTNLDELEPESRRPQKRFDYLDLVGSQILQSISYPDLWEEAGNPNRLADERLPSHWNARLCFAMQTYIDRIDEIVKEMARRGFKDLNEESNAPNASDIVKDAWWTMALRAMCWHRAVSFVSGPTPGEVFAAPSQFHGSKIPVLIA